MSARVAPAGAIIASVLPLITLTALYSRLTVARKGNVRATMGYVAVSTPVDAIQKNTL